jgi:PAS domain S-box-containing protein
MDDETQRLALAAQATRDVIRDWNIASATISFSESLATEWGHALRSEVDASWWEAQIHPDDAERVRESLERAFRSSDERWRGEYRFRRGDGTYGFVLERGLLIRSADGKVTRLIASMQDVTTRVDAEQVERLNTLGRIAATLAHDFNNVLMGIQPFAELVRKRTTDPRLTQAANHILKSVARGRRVTLDILRTRQMATPALREVDLVAWLHRTQGEIAALVTERVKVQFIAPEEPVFASCDSSQLQQVVANLAVNAHEAMRDGGTLTITLGVAPKDASSFELTVNDSGNGIAPDVLPHIFEPLYTTKKSGIGLGLTVVQQIITRHNGTISVESSRDEGTTFCIRLPRIIRAPIPSASTDGSALERILLVEDDEVVADGLVQLLATEGLHVDVVTHGALVIEAIERLAPHAVILDVGLPDVNGVEVYERIAERWPDLAVLFSSGNADTRVLSRYVGHPRVRFLHKPYDVGELMRVLHEIT